MKTTSILGGYLAACLLMVGCTSTPVDTSDTLPSEPDVESSDASSASSCPSGFVNLTFSVDDTANKTYGDDELIWTGSFSWDEATNVLTYATSWLPEEGPYPSLKDDGPQSAGGHEPEGSEAGDHVFGASVCYKASEDKLFDYGVLNDELRWIWIGPNGQIEVKAQSEGIIDVPGFTLSEHGELDFKALLDLGALHSDFEGVTLETHKVYVKGTMNSWTPVQLLDNGELGDEVAGDGILTYQHSLFLGPHDGLLNPGQEAQFVFVFAMEGIGADDGMEYKIEGDASLNGVGGQADCGEGWTNLEPTLSLDSKGKSMNTALRVCSGNSEPECGEAKTCETGGTCIDGVCVPDDLVPPQLFVLMPNTGSAAGGTEVMLYGEHLKSNATVLFDEAEAEILSGGGEELLVKTPPGLLGKVDVKVVTSAGETLFPDAYTYVEEESAPYITSVEPAQGQTGGGTNVTIYGGNFAEGTLVAFGTAPASSVEVAQDGTSIAVVTPPHPAVSVVLKITNPDGQGTTLVDGFTYTEKVADWGILEGVASIVTTAGDSISLTGQVYEGGITDSDGPGFSVSAEVGYGAPGTEPNGEEPWTWSDASYVSELGNNDRWSGTLTIPEGVWSATMRFSLNGGTSWLYVDLDGDDNGFQADNVLAVTSEAAGTVNITSLSPATLPPFGGQLVELAGNGFDAQCTLTIDNLAVDVSFVNEETMTFLAPAHAPGSVQVTLDCPKGSDVATLNYEANWDGLLTEWSAANEYATSDTKSDWGDENTLNALYVASDDEFLYIAIDGQAMGFLFGPHAITAYIDTDFGMGTGVVNTSDFENEGAVDNALGSALTFSIDGFGAEVAFASLNMASYDALNEDGPKGDAGWRKLSPAVDLPWLLSGSVLASETGIEAILPLDALYGAPSGVERQIGIAVRLGNVNGEAQSNQSLPEEMQQAALMTFVY
jgi:hypothetical protein